MSYICYIFDSCNENFEFGDGFGLRAKCVGVPNVFRNGNDVTIQVTLSIILYDKL